MVKSNPRIDAYIAQAPEYAQPILTKLRELFHRAHPGIEEAVKWGKPSFEYKGMVGGMAAFKKHVSFGFWKAKAMKDPHGIFQGAARASPFAIKASSLKDLPPARVLLAYVRTTATRTGRRGRSTQRSARWTAQNPRLMNNAA